MALLNEFMRVHKRRMKEFIKVVWIICSQIGLIQFTSSTQ